MTYRRLISISIALALSTGIIACSTNPSQNIPLPPKDLTSKPVVLPNPTNAKTPNVSESQALKQIKQTESATIRFKQISEERGPGGAINKVIITNPKGGMPSYSLSPTLDQQTQTNNNPDKLSVPNWQLSW